MGGSERGVVRFGCPGCGARLKALAKQAGGKLRCPECGEAVRVPEAEAAPAEVDRAAPQDDLWIAVECRVCHTRMDARPNQVGQKIACPDCNTLATVPPPPPRPKKVELVAPKETLGVESLAPAPRDLTTGPTTEIVCPHCGFRQTTPVDQLGRKRSCTGCFLIFIPTSPPTNGDGFDDELKLSAPAPRRKPTLPDFDLDDDDDEPPPAPAEPFAARPELSRPLGPRAKLPDWPLVSGVFGFPLRGGVWQRWVSLSLGLAAILVLANSAHSVTRGVPQWIAAVFFSALAVFGAGLWYIFGPSILLAIFQDTAAGNDDVESWPDGPWIDTALEGLYIVCALGTAGIVSAGLWEGAKLIGLSPGVSAILSGLLGFVAFPVFLLSMIEQGSMLMPVSGPVWGSLISGWKWWAVFLVETLLLDLGVGYAMQAAARLLPNEGVGMVQIAAFAGMAALFVAYLIVYFRLLGRLAWCCEEVLSLKAAENNDEPPRLNDRRPAHPAPQPAPAASERPRYTGPSDDDDDFLSGI